MALYYKVSATKLRDLRQAAIQAKEVYTESIFNQVRRTEIRDHRLSLHMFRVWQRGVKSVETSDRPCICGRSHYALNVVNGETYSLCPIRYYMKMCQLKLSTGDLPRWTESQPLSKFLARLPGAADATFMEEQ